MANNKITFYASDKVCDWYNNLPPQTGSKEINRILEEALSKPRRSLDQRVEALEGALKEIAEIICQADQPALLRNSRVGDVIEKLTN